MPTLNEKYGTMNIRFDRRALELVIQGFQHEILLEYHIAVFSRKNPVTCKTEYITASFVMYADEPFWQDKMEDLAS